MPTRWQNSTDEGSPPCSPQMPTFRCALRLPAPLDADPDQLAHPLLVEHRERVGGQQLLLEVEGQELADVVAAVAERHLGQVVGAEREELGVLRDLVRDQRGPRHLDHGAHRVRRPSGPSRVSTCSATRTVISRVSFISATVPVSGIMISGSTRTPRRRHLAGRLHDGPHLHLVDLGERDAEPAAAVAEHRDWPRAGPRGAP